MSTKLPEPLAASFAGNSQAVFQATSQAAPSTSRSPEGRALAERLGARQTFGLNEKLPRRVDVVVDNIGQATWEHSLQSVRAGGTVVTVGVTTRSDPGANLLRLVSEKITVMGSIMGTLEEMNNMIRFVIDAGIKPKIGAVIPMEDAKKAILAVVEGRTHGKTIFTR